MTLRQRRWVIEASRRTRMVQLLPYLRLKHRQAELPVALIRLVKHEKVGTSTRIRGIRYHRIGDLP
jgi:hypothetical protein